MTELLPCHWRGEPVSETGFACHLPGGRLLVSRPGVGAETCNRCIYRNRVLPGEAPAPWPPSGPSPVIVRGNPRTLPCLHLGPPTGARRLCPSCKGHVEVKVLACALYGECTAARPLAGLACCATCADYRAA